MSLNSLGPSNGPPSSRMTHSLSTPSGVDGSTTTHHTRGGGKKLAVRVQMLDDSMTLFQVQVGSAYVQYFVSRAAARMTAYTKCSENIWGERHERSIFFTEIFFLLCGLLRGSGSRALLTLNWINLTMQIVINFNRVRALSKPFMWLTTSHVSKDDGWFMLVQQVPSINKA